MTFSPVIVTPKATMISWSVEKCLPSMKIATMSYADKLRSFKAANFLALARIHRRLTLSREIPNVSGIDSAASSYLRMLIPLITRRSAISSITGGLCRRS